MKIFNAFKKPAQLQLKNKFRYSFRPDRDPNKSSLRFLTGTPQFPSFKVFDSVPISLSLSLSHTLQPKLAVSAPRDLLCKGLAKVMAEGEEDLPRDAKIVKSLLKSMGVEDYEPRVIHQFLELWYRYVVDVLTDAQVYSEHAGKQTIDCDDVKLAIQSKVNFSFSQPPPREVLLELARNRNKVPLPKAIPGPGIPLPPEQDTLINTNYQFAVSKKQPAQAMEETEEDEESVEPNPSHEHEDMPQPASQRVSFPLTKRSK